MPTVQKSGKYYYKIDKNGKKTRISQEEYYKVSKTKIRNKKKKTNDCMIGGVIDDFIFRLSLFYHLVCFYLRVD